MPSSHGARRFHEAGVGSRTGLRLSAVARDQDGFEDLETFYRASQAAMDHGGVDEESDQSQDEDSDGSLIAEAVSRSRARPTGSSSMDIQNSSMPSPQRANRGSGALVSSSPHARRYQSTAGPSSSPRRQSNGRANITLADDYDIRSDQSRSFDLLAMAGDDAAAMEGEDDNEAHMVPPTPIPASKLQKGRASKGKRPEYLDDSDGDMYDIPAYAPEDDYGIDDYDAIPSAPIQMATSRPKTVSKGKTIPTATKAKPKKKQQQPVEPTYEEYDDPQDMTTPPAPKAKKPKMMTSAKSSKAKPRAPRHTQVIHPQLQSSVIDEDGLRRSTRQKFEPLEYWRGERIRYGRPSLPKGITPADLRGDKGVEEVMFRKRVPVLDIKEVIRVPREPGEGTFSGAKVQRSAVRARAKKEERATGSPHVEEEFYPHLDPKADTMQPEDGWDEQTVATGLVIDADTGEEVEKVIVRTRASIHPTPMHPYEFSFEKIFTFGGQMGVGVLHLGPGKRKDTKANKDDFVFTVMQGALRVQVHRKVCTVGPGGIFHVPAGNNYSLKNICERDVHLFVASARGTRKNESNDMTMFTQVGDTSYATPGRPILQDLHRNVASSAPARPRYPASMEPSPEPSDDDEDDRVEEPPAPVRSPVKKATKRIVEPTVEDEDDFESSRTLKTTKRKFRKIG